MIVKEDMRKKVSNPPTRISEIYCLSRVLDDEGSYLGFTICHPDGTIENIIMEYLSDEYEQALALMKVRRERLVTELQKSPD